MDETSSPARMKAALVASPGKVELVEVPRPSPAQGEILVGMRCCGMCGTDVEKVYGGGMPGKVLGHEAVGEVEEVGPGVEGVARGMRVFAHHHVGCGSCALCKRGKSTYCLEYQRHNLVPCGLAESYLVPKFNVERGAVHELPSGLGYEEASFIEPLATCILGLANADAKGAGSAVIYGAGPVGLLHLKLLQSYGVPRVSVGDTSGYRRSFAARVGADAVFDPADPGSKAEAAAKMADGPELVVVATGSPRAFEDAAKTVTRGGRVLLFGAPPRGSTGTMDISHFFHNGTEVVTSYAATEDEVGSAIRLIAGGEVRVADLVTHRFPLADAARAFEAAAQQQCVKALIVN